MKIYFSGSIRGGRGDADLYREIIEELRNYGTVLTEHIGYESIEEELDDREIHKRDMEWLTCSEIVIAEVTNPSLGVGYEIGRAVEMNKRIVCCYREVPGKRLSAMITGSDALECRSYRGLDELRSILKEIFGD